MRALWLVNQLWVIVPVNPQKNRASSELVSEITRPRVQFVINRYEWFWKFSKLYEPLGECNLRIFKITSTYYSRIVREGRVIFYL